MGPPSMNGGRHDPTRVQVLMVVRFNGAAVDERRKADPRGRA